MFTLAKRIRECAPTEHLRSHPDANIYHYCCSLMLYRKGIGRSLILRGRATSGHDRRVERRRAASRECPSWQANVAPRLAVRQIIIDCCIALAIWSMWNTVGTWPAISEGLSM